MFISVGFEQSCVRVQGEANVRVAHGHLQSLGTHPLLD